MMLRRLSRGKERRLNYTCWMQVGMSMGDNAGDPPAVLTPFQDGTAESTKGESDGVQFDD